MSRFEDYVTVPDAAERLQIHPESVRRLIRKGQLPAKKFGNSWLVERDVLEQFATGYDRRPGNKAMLFHIKPQKQLDTPEISPEEPGMPGVFIDHTLRGGRAVRSNGHVIVYGDVNPGAEIVAAGSVIIWGRLRGTVHAGANGDESAVVCALDLAPTQLRIAGYITVSPPDKRRKPLPEIASVRQGRIVAEAWNG